MPTRRSSELSSPVTTTISTGTYSCGPAWCFGARQMQFGGSRGRRRQSRAASSTSNVIMAAARGGEGAGMRPSDVSPATPPMTARSEEHTYELQSLMRNSYAVFCLKKKQGNEAANTQSYRQDNIQ